MVGRSERLRHDRSRLVLVLVGIAAVALCAACAGSDSRGVAGGSRPSGPVNVPVRVLGGPGTPVGARPVVDVRVGNGPSVPVLLDTGGNGLEMYPSGLDLRPGGGIAMTSHRFGLVYDDGSIQRGSVASAKVAVGGVTTDRNIKFGVIRSVGCARSEPHCPLDGISPARGVYGVLGTSLREIQPGLQNPLIDLPAPYSRSWSIHLSGLQGVLTLGAPLPSNPAAELQFPAEKSPRGDPPAFDDAAAPVCWRFGDARLCLPTLFDTGSNQMAWFSPNWRPEARPYLDVGTIVSAAQEGAGRPFWRFSSGTGSSQDVVSRPTSAYEKVNAGVQAFYAFKITYDPIHGRLFLTAPGTPANRVRVSIVLREANAICVSATEQGRRVTAKAPPYNAHDLASVERAVAFVIRRFAVLTLRADRALSRLRLPASDKSRFDRALVSREGEAQQMLSFANSLTRYRTWNDYNRAGWSSQSRLKLAQRTWSSDMNQLGIGGCTTL